jgi:hypothetical protein
VETTEQVSERMVEAFKIDRRLPRVQSPKAPGGAHPPIARSTALRYEVAMARKLAGIEDEPATIRPTQTEIDAMEKTFALLPDIFAADREGYECLRVWCARMAEPVKGKGERSLRSIAERLGMPTMKLLRRKDRARSLSSSSG